MTDADPLPRDRHLGQTNISYPTGYPIWAPVDCEHPMTWVKITDTFPGDPRWDECSDRNGAIATHVAALCHCSTYLTDGQITRRAVKRLDVDDPDASAKELVKAGFWRETDTGYEIMGYLNDQESATEVERRRAANAERQRAYRERVQANREKAIRNGVTNAATDGVTNAGSNATPSRPVPTRPDRKGGRGGRDLACGSPSAGATGSPTARPLVPIKIKPVIKGGDGS